MISINPIKQVFLVFALVLILQLKQSDCKFSAPILDEDIGQSIFHENQLYLIYVCDDVDSKVQSIFNQYCEEEEKLCTILSPEVDRFTDFKAFIGETKDQYFAILDVQRRQKFVLPYLDGMTSNDLRIFQSKFQQGLLQPFFASEKPDPKTYERCQRLVGKNLDEFLNSQAEIKVVFLYTQHSACEVCGEMLREYADLAERLYQKNIVIFGYFDIFKNDHPRITDQILPYFLIFSKDGEEPYGLEGQKFHELQETIIQIGLKNTDIDLDKFRREHTFNKGEKPQKQYEINYKIKGEKVERTNLQQL